MTDFCTHAVLLQTGGWTRETDPESLYYEAWVHGDPECRKPRRPKVQYVRVEVAEGKAYTYEWHGDPPLEAGEWVTLPSNQMRKDSFAGKVLRVLDGPDPHYSGEYKAVIERLL